MFHSAKNVSAARRGATQLMALGLILVLAQFASGTVQSYRVISRSMQPTLMVGDYVLMFRPHQLLNLDLKGRVIVFESDDDGFALTKRVVAAANDRVALQNGRLYIDGHRDPHSPQRIKYVRNRQWRVGEDRLFVAGDNRNNSYDSIDHGPIESARVMGVVAMRVWPLERFGLL